jgi:LytS/YehU family sensor histidine kinase
VTRRVQRIRAAERSKTELNRKMAELEMQALRAQINPHFIFNALNSIQNYYSQNDERNANRYLTNFATLIRQTLTHSRDNWLTLADEIAMIRTYIELERMRFRDKFSYNILVDDAVDTEQIKIPAMLIQPYVENAIHHGLRHLASKGGLLSISFSIRNKQLVCIIDDNGVGFSQAAEMEKRTTVHRSLGMEITKNRIETIGQLYNMHIGISIRDKDTTNTKAATGTEVQIIIPLTPETQNHEKASHNNCG